MRYLFCKMVMVLVGGMLWLVPCGDAWGGSSHGPGHHDHHDHDHHHDGDHDDDDDHHDHHDHGKKKKKKKDKELEIEDEREQLDFGTVAKPLSGSGQIVVNNNGDVDVSRTTLPFFSSGTGRGKNKIKGGRGDDIMINFVGSAAGGFELKDFDVKYYRYAEFVDNGSQTSEFGPYPSEDKGKYLEHGATLIISSSATPGTHYIPYQIMVRRVSCSQHNSHNDCTVMANRLAVIRIIQPLNVVGGDDMDFKDILKPTRNSIIKMETDGTMTVKKGAVTFLQGNDGTPGTLVIEGQPGERISVEADFVSAPSGLKLDKFTGRYGGVEEKIYNPKNFTLLSGAHELKIGAELSIDAKRIELGHHTMIYEVNINYD